MSSFEKKDLSDKEIKKILKDFFKSYGGSLKSFDRDIQRQLIMGYRVELEHSSRVDARLNVTDGDTLKTVKIALVHIKEGMDYYDRLKKMEEEMDEHWKSPDSIKKKEVQSRSVENIIVLLSK